MAVKVWKWARETYENSPGTGSTQPRPDTALNVKFCIFFSAPATEPERKQKIVGDDSNVEENDSSADYAVFACGAVYSEHS